MAALALVLSFIENRFVLIPACPGVKLGLSNVAVMLALFFVSKKTAYGIALLKALFSFATRGVMAGVLSLSGGVASVTLIILIILIDKNASYSVLGISGALCHNLMQFTLIYFAYGGVSFLPYLPLLIISGIVFGILNSALLKAIFPHFKKIIKNELL
ncbi:MAG: Gx transporter family protein [Clostridia bacterium]|nr:Gx transporter family protein [Clostridia bacterium]